MTIRDRADPACPHGVTLADFCRQLHTPDQPTDPDRQPSTCVHGVPLDLFCRQLHTTNREI